MTRLSLIAAVADNRVIGRAGQLPWRLPADLARFREQTWGHHVVVGRRTWESIDRLLPGRTVVVLSRDPGYRAAGVATAGSLDEALRLAGSDPEVFVAGGAELFAQALPLADRLYLTRVHAEVEGDALFPELDPAAWQLVAREEHAADQANRYPLSFLRYELLDR